MFGFLALLTVAGNVLTILIFLKQSLRKRAHYLLISLAVADLLVGLLTVPLYIAVTNVSFVFSWLFNYTDIFTGLTSIGTLAVISLERMCAIGWPLRHRTLGLRAYKFAIVTPWVFAAIVTSLQVLRRNSIIGNDGSVVVISSPTVPLLVICFSYCVIWWKERSRMGQRSQHLERERKLTKTLFLIVAASLLTWLPFQIFSVVIFFLPARNEWFAIMYSIKFLQFSNSLVNVIIYPFRISEFKVAMLRMFQCSVTPFRSEPSRRSHDTAL